MLHNVRSSCGTFREYSGNIQGILREYSVSIHSNGVPHLVWATAPNLSSSPFPFSILHRFARGVVLTLRWNERAHQIRIRMDLGFGNTAEAMFRAVQCSIKFHVQYSPIQYRRGHVQYSPIFNNLLLHFTVNLQVDKKGGGSAVSQFNVQYRRGDVQYSSI